MTNSIVSVSVCDIEKNYIGVFELNGLKEVDKSDNFHDIIF